MNAVLAISAMLAAVVLMAAAYLVFRIHRASLWLMRRAITEETLRRELLNHRQQHEAREYLAKLLNLDPGDLPPAGGWAASADFLILLAEYILVNKPAIIVEFGSGLTTLVCARCTQINGQGRVITFDHDPIFAAVTRNRAHRLSLPHEIHVVELIDSADYPGKFYDIDACSASVDLIVVDGPPMAVHPETRGAAGPAVFARLSANGAILLDDANRSGERAVVDRWKREFPQIRFSRIDTEKGAVIGIKAS